MNYEFGYADLNRNTPEKEHVAFGVFSKGLVKINNYWKAAYKPYGI